MNLLYPRTATIRRSNVTSSTQGGAIGFAGDDPVTNETQILGPIPANISYKGADYRNPTELPADARGARYLVTIPAASAPNGTIKVGDIVVDDLGLRYKVSAPDFQLLGYELQTEFMTP